jgi:hypothetical protein
VVTFKIGKKLRLQSQKLARSSGAQSAEPTSSSAGA